MNNLALDIFNKFMSVSHEFDISQDDMIRLATYAADAAEDLLFSDEFTKLLDQNIFSSGWVSPKDRIKGSLQMALGYTKEFS